MSANASDGVLAGRHADGSGLYVIVYISTAARPLSLDELEHLRSRAQARNLEQDVTGVLLYSGGTFMQYLEGPASGLSRVYGAIKADPLHYGVIDLLRGAIREREFAGWSMGLRDVGELGQPSSAWQAFLPKAEPVTPAPVRSAALALLRSFWLKGHKSVAATLLDFAHDRDRRLGQLPAV